MRGVTNSNSFRNHGKVKILHFVLCVKAISVLHMEEKMISIDTRTPQTIRDMWMLHNGKDSKQFWCKLSDCKLKPKICEN